MLYDSHAHLEEDMIEEVQAACASGLLSFVNDIGCDLASSKLAVEHAMKYPWCFATVGIHPSETYGIDDMTIALIKGLAKKPKVVGIGEIGLDYHYPDTDAACQQKWFREQIRLANELGMPIVIHSRDADRDCMDILREEGAFSAERKARFPKRVGPDGELLDDARVLLHCYSGSAEFAKEYLRLGATISVAGPVTYGNNRKTVAVVEQVPLEFLLVETDSPYLTPEPLRGRPNRPSYVEYTARRVAEIKGLDYENVAQKTCENAQNFFKNV